METNLILDTSSISSLPVETNPAGLLRLTTKVAQSCGASVVWPLQLLFTNPKKWNVTFFIVPAVFIIKILYSSTVFSWFTTGLLVSPKVVCARKKNVKTYCKKKKVTFFIIIISGWLMFEHWTDLLLAGVPSTHLHIPSSSASVRPIHSDFLHCFVKFSINTNKQACIILPNLYNDEVVFSTVSQIFWAKSSRSCFKDNFTIHWLDTERVARLPLKQHP